MNRIYLLLLIILGTLSCSKEEFLTPYTSNDGMPGKFFGKIALDSKGGLWLQTSEIDTTVKVPSYSSYLPIRSYLSRLFNDSYEIYDDRFKGAGEMIIDKYDRLWFISNNKLFYLNNNKYDDIYEGSNESGYFEWISTDKNNNIWAGGWNVPLLEINVDPKVKVNILSDNSTSLNSSAGCFDNNNNLWLILSPQNIGRRATTGNWTFYNPDNSSLPYQAFWCITADEDNNIWAGTGYPDSEINLMKFNGTTWESVTVMDDKGMPVHGTVRQIYSAFGKIWIVTEFTKNSAFDSNYLITFDGKTWNRIYNVPSDDGISDIEFDLINNKAWIATWNKGLFTISIGY